MLDSVLQKDSMSVDPHFIDVWVPMHRDDPEATLCIMQAEIYRMGGMWKVINCLRLRIIKC
jgi:hypothetical protein